MDDCRQCRFRGEVVEESRTGALLECTWNDFQKDVPPWAWRANAYVWSGAARDCRCFEKWDSTLYAKAEGG